MFTGLVQDIGSIESVEGGADGARLRIATRLGRQIRLGDSIAGHLKIAQYEELLRATAPRAAQDPAALFPTASETKERHVRCDQRDQHGYRHPYAPVNPISIHGSLRRFREHEVEAAHAHRSALDTPVPGLFEQCHDVARVNVSMAVDMCKKP